LLNRSFDLIVQRLDELGQTGLFTSRDLREMRGLTQEVQLEINTGPLDSVEPVENNDWAHFGKARMAMEKRLRDPDDVFIRGRTKEATRQTEQKAQTQVSWLLLPAFHQRQNRNSHMALTTQSVHNNVRRRIRGTRSWRRA
jgi:hypothetical protein